MANDAFKEIFGFNPMKNERWRIESAIILAKLCEFANAVRAYQKEVDSLLEKYPSCQPAENVPQAMKDLEAIRISIENKESLHCAWKKAVETANAEEYSCSEKIEDYQSA